MKKEIYTFQSTPFALGGIQRSIKTTVEEFEVVKIGIYTCLFVKNTQKNLWHCAEADCGAIIGTNKSKTKLLKQVRGGIESGDPEIMKKQVEQGKIDCSNASMMEQDIFFSHFRES